jgi:hypothetical protein
MAHGSFLKTAAPLAFLTFVRVFNFLPITNGEITARDEGSDTISVTLNSFQGLTI